MPRIGHLLFASVSKRVPEQNLSYESEFCQHESDESLNEMCVRDLISGIFYTCQIAAIMTELTPADQIFISCYKNLAGKILSISRGLMFH